MVVGDIDIRISVLKPSDALNNVHILRRGILFRAFKHHVLQKMAHAVNGRRFIPAPHPHHDCSCHATHAAHGDENQP